MAYPAFKDSLFLDHDFGPQSSRNLIFFVIFDDNYKVSVPIGKLMTRGFQNTPYFWILLKIEGAMALQNKVYYFVWPSVHKRSFWTWFQHASLNLLSPFSQLPWVQIGKFQCPSSWEFPKFLGTPLNFHPIVILKGDTANQTANHEGWVLPLGTVYVKPKAKS